MLDLKEDKLYADEHEPTDITRFIDGVLPLEVLQLNQLGWGDWAWRGVKLSHVPGHDGTYNLERKTWDDFISDPDGIEEQVREEISEHPNTIHRLLVEGVIEPAPSGILVYHRRSGQNVFAGGLRGRQPQLAKRIFRWLADADDFIRVIPSTGYAYSAQIIGWLYQGDHKPESERTIFQRYQKKVTFHPNAQVMGLMGTCADMDWGPVICSRLIAKFGTRWNVYRARPEELAQVAGVGLDGARSFLRKIGRPDV